MQKANYACDLHSHTNRSDGQDSPRELIDRAADRGLKAVAITDHDVRPPEAVETDQGLMEIISYGRSKGVLILPGIEVSCDPRNEDVHMVGLGCDFHCSYFLNLEQKVRQSKLESYRQLVEKLNGCGYAISWLEVLESTGNGAHPEQIQKKQIFELMAQKGIVTSWREAKKMTQTDLRLVVSRWKPDPRDVIRCLHHAGGIAILAHPYLIYEPIEYQGHSYSRKEYIQLLIAAGLDGIEACYTYSKTSYRGTLRQEEIEQEVRSSYGDVLKVISGGSDYHGDGKKGVENSRDLGECGVTWEYFSNNQTLLQCWRK